MFIYLPYTLRFCVSGFLAYLAYLTFDLIRRCWPFKPIFLCLLKRDWSVTCNIVFILQRLTNTGALKCTFTVVNNGFLVVVYHQF